VAHAQKGDAVSFFYFCWSPENEPLTRPVVSLPCLVRKQKVPFCFGFFLTLGRLFQSGSLSSGFSGGLIVPSYSPFPPSPAGGGWDLFSRLGTNILFFTIRVCCCLLFFSSSARGPQPPFSSRWLNGRVHACPSSRTPPPFFSDAGSSHLFPRSWKRVFPLFASSRWSPHKATSFLLVKYSFFGCGRDLLSPARGKDPTPFYLALPLFFAATGAKNLFGGCRSFFFRDLSPPSFRAQAREVALLLGLDFAPAEVVVPTSRDERPFLLPFCPCSSGREGRSFSPSSLRLKSSGVSFFLLLPVA